MITFLINFPTPIATICPLLLMSLWKEIIYSILWTESIFLTLGLFYATYVAFIYSLEILQYAFIKQNYFL